jgi:hypothetical protein
MKQGALLSVKNRSNCGTNTITNPPVKTGLIPLIMMKRITLLSLLMMFFITGAFAQVPDAPVTKAQKRVVTDPLPAAVTVDVTVDNLVHVSGFGLTLLYDPAIMQFGSVTNVLGALSGLSVAETFLGSGVLKMTWIAASPSNNIASLPNGTVLFTLNFVNYNGGTSMLTWVNDPNLLSEYAGPFGQNPDLNGIGDYPDLPTADFYKNGYVTNIDAEVEDSVTVCNAPNYGEIIITATGGSNNFIFKIDDGTPVTNTTGIFTNLPSGTYAVSVIDAAFPTVELIIEPAVQLIVPTVNGYLYNPRLLTYYCTIGDAVTAAADGDVIQFVYPKIYTGFTYNDPSKALSFVDMTNGQVIFKGASPAFTLNSGNISFTGVSFITATNDPTILINGGKLTLRSCTITEAAGFTQAGVYIAAGELDAGITGNPGLNVFSVTGSGMNIVNAGTTQASALCNFYGEVTLFYVSSKIAGDVVFDPWSNATLTNCGYSQFGGPVTYAGEVFAPTGIVTVPIKVENFNNIDAISLALQFDASNLTFNSITFTHPALALTPVFPNVVGNTLFIAWNADPSLTSGVTISGPGQQLLFNLQFTTTTGTYPLVWDNNPTILCEYQNALIQGPYIDEPTLDFYKDGFISDLNATVTASTNVICKGANDGTITVVATGGSASYTYKVNAGTPITQPTGLFTGLAPGVYTISVIDNNYPMVEYFYPTTVTIAEPVTPLTGAGFESIRVRCKGESNGQATMNAAGGWGGIQYSINGINYQVNNYFDALPVGVYTLYARDMYGCVITDIVNITEPIVALTASGIESKVVTCKGGNDGQVTLTGYDGWGGYLYSKDNLNYYLTPTLSDFSVGTYTLYVKDDGGCTKQVSVTITEPSDALAVTATMTKVVSCKDGNDGEITAYPFGGWGTYTFSLNGGTYQTSALFTGLTAGSYTVSVKDFYGCVVSINNVVVTEPALLTGVISGNNTVCHGQSSMVTINFAGGNPPYTVVYKTITGSNQTISGINASSYSFTQPYMATTTWNLVSLTDAKNCVGVVSGSATITVNPLPVVTSADLLTSTNLSNWNFVGGDLNNGYVMCIDPVIPYNYLDIAALTLANLPLAASGFAQNAFYLDVTALPVDFYTYWAAKGVVSGATGWQAIMWPIINGTAPMFYINYDGSDYTLVDGLQYQAGGGAQTLRISGDYPQGLYTFTGTVLDQNGCTSLPFNIALQLNSSPVVSDITLLQSTDNASWVPVAGTFAAGFEMCVDATVTYHFLDVASVSSTVNALQTGMMNKFFLDGTTLPTGFFAYWAAKGVISGATGWQGIMWDIINGDEPMFYMEYDGADYVLIDGLQYLYTSGALKATLRISGDYPAGTYNFMGTVTDINGCISSPFSIEMTFVTMPQPNAGADMVVCNAPAYQLAAATPIVGAGTWTYTGPGIAVITDPGNVSSTVTVDVAGAYTFTWTETNGICEKSDVVVITFLKGTNADAYTLAPVSAISAVSGAPVVTKFTYNLPMPDVNADPNIKFDGLFKVVGGTFPTGMKVTEIRRFAAITTTYFKVVNGDLSGKDHVLFSDLVGFQHPLFDNSLNQYNWVLTIEDAAGTTGTLNVDFALVTYITKPVDLLADCYAVLDNASYTLTYNEAVITTQDVAVCLNDPLPFQISIAYPIIANVDVNSEILLDAKLTITAGGPLNAGATLLWGYNAPATIPSATNIDGKTTLLLSDIVGGSPMPLSGHSGTDVWNIIINGANVGVYDIKTEGLALITVVEPTTSPLQIPGLPANPSNIYPAPSPSEYVVHEYSYAEENFTLTVNPLPTITLTDAAPKVCYGATSVDFPYTGTTNNPDLYSIAWDVAALANGFSNVTGATLPASPIVVSMTGAAAQGIYTASLTVVNSVTGCISQVYTISVNVPAPLMASAVETTSVSCNGGSDGVATASVMGGWSPYDFLWNDPAAQTTAVATGLSAGMYSVVVTDDLGCTTTAMVMITEPDVLNGQLSKTDITCFGLTNGTITISNPTGGYGTYEYRLDLGAWQSSNVFVGLAAGTYAVEIRDAANTSCTMVIGTLTIVEPAPNMVSGVYTYHNFANTPLNLITVNLQQGSTVLYTTGTATNGTYSFPNVCPGTYNVVAATTKSTLGSVNSTDAVQANLWGLSSSTIQKVAFGAGDVNMDDLVNSGDAGDILDHFLSGGTLGFVRGPWVFWKTNEAISSNPFVDGAYPVITVGSSSLVQNFYGLASGDFNRSFTPGSSKNGSSVTVTNKDGIQADGSVEILLPVTVGSDMDVTAISLALNYPADKVEVLGVALGNDLQSAVRFEAQNGVLRIAHASLMPLMLNQNNALVTLRLKALPAFTPGESVTFILAADPLNELAGADYQGMPSALLNISVIEGVVSVPEAPFTGLIEVANYPNPFAGTTNFTYNLPVDGHVSLAIYDMTGRLITTVVSEVQSAGTHTVALDQHLETGVYMANLLLTTGQGTISRTIRIMSRN